MIIKKWFYYKKGENKMGCSSLKSEGWRVKISLEVEGPKEGPQVITMELPDTTRVHAQGIQAYCTHLLTEINKQGELPKGFKHV